MLKIDKLFNLDVLIFMMFGIIGDLKRLPNYRKNINLFKKNEQLKKMKTSNRCYICGNGPSLRQVNFQALEGDTIVVNDFFRFGKVHCEGVDPTFYMIVDNSYLDEKFDSRLETAINSYSAACYVFSDDFIPYLTKMHIEKENFYFFYLSRNLFTSKKKSIDFTKKVMGCQNVVGNAIALALYLGYEEIILLGCDFNLFATVNIEHCYTDDDGGRRINLSNMLFRYSFVTYVHYQLAIYAKKVNTRIINATNGSLLDAYPRQDL